MKTLAETPQAVAEASDILKGLHDTPTNQPGEIDVLAHSLTDRIEEMRGHEKNEVTDVRECDQWVCSCLFVYAPGDLEDLSRRLHELSDVLERTKFFYEWRPSDFPIRGAQQRRWYDRGRPRTIAALRTHADNLAGGKAELSVQSKAKGEEN